MCGLYTTVDTRQLEMSASNGVEVKESAKGFTNQSESDSAISDLDRELGNSLYELMTASQYHYIAFDSFN